MLGFKPLPTLGRTRLGLRFTRRGGSVGGGFLCIVGARQKRAGEQREKESGEEMAGRYALLQGGRNLTERAAPNNAWRLRNLSGS